ncbi:hypothetical protein AMELA_G00189850 [Ameiurus melas]|uniref:Uncharacterized protein n=1 Tax=Ameiurus melas TaxID=219545 RepID=A0A7J6A8T8_AMEME|nr:hypothetical protein AMELA_G00189850 [Ameiurus melas]
MEPNSIAGTPKQVGLEPIPRTLTTEQEYTMNTLIHTYGIIIVAYPRIVIFSGVGENRKPGGNPHEHSQVWKQHDSVFFRCAHCSWY